jgi:hypothetical protein
VDVDTGRGETGPEPMPVPRRHAVEHRDGERGRPLGWVPDAFPHHSTLQLFLSWLLLDEGGGGQLVLVDEATGEVAARRAVGPARTPPTGQAG